MKNNYSQGITIHCNKKITKQPNSYAIRISITLQCLLQSTKRAINLNQQSVLKKDTACVQWKCPVEISIGHVQIRTRVQEWTRVRHPTCPVETSTRNKPRPLKKGSVYFQYFFN